MPPNCARHRIAARERFEMKPKGRGWAARGALGRSTARRAPCSITRTHAKHEAA